MAILFQVLRGFFYFFTLVVGVFLVRGNIIFGDDLFASIQEILMPGYLLFCGVMIGYIIAVIRQGKKPSNGDFHIEQSILNKSFIIGIIIGIILAICCIVLKGK